MGLTPSQDGAPQWLWVLEGVVDARYVGVDVVQVVSSQPNPIGVNRMLPLH